MAAVVTADIGGVDDLPLAPVAQRGVDVDWWYFTDDPEQCAPEPWRTEYVQPVWPEEANLSAKVYKMLPQPDVGRDVVWIDANMQVVSPDFVAEALDCRRDGIAVFTHPRRHNVYQEAEASLGAESQGGKYEPWRDRIRDQMHGYVIDGFAEDRLYACGTVAWDWSHVAALTVGTAWLVECARWSPQDQLSFPYVLGRYGVTPGVFPFGQLERRDANYFGNRWWRLHQHRR